MRPMSRALKLFWTPVTINGQIASQDVLYYLLIRFIYTHGHSFLTQLAAHRLPAN